ncbi:membrane protein [Youngiibacter fragilis 232.1]|uniref:Membrane protein n=1 Tax=Youngiibacter fragilis 232.1 TaxID=994573 RepID=V7I2R8_9CLOT|nr:membrane protein [Youngiibacter fragilis 232.1]
MFGSNGIVASCISLPSQEIVLLRTFIGSLFLISLFRLSGQKEGRISDKRHLRFLIFSGTAMGASWMFLYEAYRLIGVSIASLLYYCGPVIVMAVSPVVFKERLTSRKLGGFTAVLIGIAAINMQSAYEGRSNLGLLYGGLSAMMYAFMVIFSKKACSISGMRNSMLQLVVSFLTVAACNGIKSGLVIQVTKGDWIPILVLGAINTGFGCCLYFSSINRLPVQTVATLGYLEPLSAVAFSVVFLNEMLQPSLILGAALIIGGAVFAEGRSME